jgi:probable F420-dependent oxidoreductase
MPTPSDSMADLIRFARLAEDRGIESIWLGEHSHLPVPTEHAFHDETPKFYRHVPDPYIALAAIAAATSSIRLGTGISLPAEYEPLTLAKMLATLDQASNGRFEWGIGYGWNKLEMVNRGLDPNHRMSTFREVVLAVKRLWVDDIAEYDGDHVRFTPSWSWPKPAQQPHPPIWLGCRAGPRAFGQLAEFCDGWLPSIGQSIDHIESQLEQLRLAWKKSLRPESELRTTFIDTGFWKDVSVQQYRKHVRISPSTVSRLRELGADRLIVGVPNFQAEFAEPMLDAVAELI